MSNYIPEEVVLIILSSLPAKSLLRFIRVCKLWRSIISNPKFIYTHLIDSEKKGAHVAILAKEPRNTSTYNSNEELIKLNLPPQCNGMTITNFACSCNGLVCLAADSSVAKIYIWNPLTRQIKMIPSPIKRYYLSKSYQYNVGFGYDSIFNDYKILRMAECNSVRLGFVVQAELYSSNADCWKEIQLPNIVSNVMIPFYSKCIQLKPGILYMERSGYMLSFDLHNEVFGVYPYPLNYKRRSSVLKFEDNYVAMIFKSIADESVSLWTLDDVCGGSKMSWMKRFNLKADWKIDWVHFILDGGQIFAKNNVYGCFLYDCKSNATKKILTNIRASTPAFNYTESLVSLRGFERQSGK